MWLGRDAQPKLFEDTRDYLLRWYEEEKSEKLKVVIEVVEELIAKTEDYLRSKNSNEISQIRQTHD